MWPPPLFMRRPATCPFHGKPSTVQTTRPVPFSQGQAVRGGEVCSGKQMRPSLRGLGAAVARDQSRLAEPWRWDKVPPMLLSGTDVWSLAFASTVRQIHKCDHWKLTDLANMTAVSDTRYNLTLHCRNVKTTLHPSPQLSATRGGGGMCALTAQRALPVVGLQKVPCSWSVMRVPKVSAKCVSLLYF